ncbi:RHS repeat-associated core domain-containing protein [Streptosporangium subroseum]|uniref:RHS repeat-associated core domain-containing protein n=1 Tax=Streptosporangium subroseum TaxID=106412 RepID=A0A239DBY0_9ACTN|nr:RHS repeat-associated core domain-containing protein [Streptosporangium subroseum]SNS29807.1 RHS repeat-associated core domain-containing protein [Streptosporangium subroseum]
MDLPDELDLPESRWNRLQQRHERPAPDVPDPSWNRFQTPKAESPWPRRLATVFSIVLVLPLAYAMPAYAEPRSAPSVQRETPVKGEKVPVLPPMTDPVQKQAWKAPPGVTWPKPQTAELGGTEARTLATGFPVRLAPQKETSAKSADAIDAAAVPVKVELLDTAGAGRLGLTMRVSPGQGAAAATSAAKDQGAAAARPGAKTRLAIDYSGFRYAYGGDYGARLQVVKLEECALDARATGCAQPQPVRSENNTQTGTLTAEVATTGLYAVVAAASGSTGDHGSTSLAPSSDWSVGPQSGDFNWGYELRTPPALGGEEPELSLGYSSQSVDGRTASTNNQPSWAGEGFELNPSGFIERRYKSCMIDGKKTGDLCWDGENVTLSLGDSAVELVKDATSKQWRPKRDDGTRIESLTGATNGDNNGEYWRVTTADGSQYTFGLNRLPGWATGKPETKSVLSVPVFGNNSGEPCYSSTPANAWCQQAYRWNLDYMVDTHGNATTYWYAQEKNYYGRTMKPELGTVYDRGGYLTRIDYGYLQGELFTKAPAARVVFDVAERCLPSGTITCAADQLKKETAGSWPDVPFDQVCDSGVKCVDRLSPTFFTRKRLTKVTTQILNTDTAKCAAAQYCAVDSWTLTHQFPATGDGLSPSLWLASIQQTGHVGGTITLPKITFAGVQLPNRVDANEGRAPLVKWRVQGVNNETGGELRVNYAPAECKPGELPAPDKNTKRCFPQRWAPLNEAEVVDWFHKYVVTQTVEVDRVAGSTNVVTDYEYLDGAAWHYADNILVKPEHRTWADFRGFGRVRVREGDGQDTKRTLTEFRYFRGMHGDRQADGSKRTVQVTDSEGVKLDDLDQYSGLEREEILYDGDGGAVLKATVEQPWSLKTAESTQGGVTKAAHIVEAKSMVTRNALPGDKWRRTGEERVYDAQGLLTQVEEKGDLATADDDQCTRYTYARNDTSWMLDYTSRIQKVAASCGTSVSTLAAAEVLSDEKVQYDGKAYGLAPSKGDVTSVQQLVSGDGTTITDSTHTYDAYGRELTETDAVGTTSTTTYTPAAGAPATEIKEVNQLGHVERTLLEPAWDEPVAEIDANNRRVDMEHDALGRLVKVWQPDRSKAAGQSPSTEFSYVMRNNGPSIVTTKTLDADGAYTVSHELYDGLMRERQTQEPAPRDDQTTDPALRDGRTITDTFYNSQGEPSKANTGYFATGTPSTDLLAVADTDVPTQVVSFFDGTGDVNAQALRSKGAEKYRVTSKQEGDRVHVTPPAGETATTRIGDAEDRLIELRQYRGATPTGEYDSTKYTYDHAGRLSTVTDSAGNVWRHHYDMRGREIKAEDPDKGVTTMAYNDADELVSTTDSRGRTLWYVYDELGRQKEMRENSATGPLLAEWKYDALAKGHMNASIRYVGGQAYRAEMNAIDADYRPLRETVTIPAREGKLAGSYVLNTRYTLDDQVQSVSFPAAGGLAEESVVYSYDELNQTTKVTGLSSYVTAARYSKLGEALQYELGTGGKKTWLTYTHDESTRRMTSMRLDREGAAATDLDLNYTYDAAGNITKIADRAGGQDTQCFNYDHLRRLTSAWTATDDCASRTPQSGKIGGVAPYAVSYAYDAIGNRTKETKHAWGGAGETARTYAYPQPGGKQPHALQSVGADLFEYDAAGNTTRRKVGTADQALVWDSEGNLESVTEAGKTTSFVYDAEGDRLIRKTPSDATLYIDDMELRFDYAADVVEQTRYYTVNDQAIAVRTPDNQVYFLAGDHQGTAQAAVNANSGQLAVRRMTPFGEDRGSPPSWWPGQRGFVGGTKDTTTGLVHLGAREYDPKFGRFMSVDPIIDDVDPQQLNAYAYANNSPVSMSDPDGQWVWVVVIIGVRLGARYAAKKAAQRAIRREILRRAREAAKKRALEAAKKKAREEAKKRALEAAKKKALAEAKKRRLAAARKKAAEKAQKAREAAAKRRAAMAARRQARKAAREAAAKKKMALAAQRRNHRAGRVPRGIQHARSTPARRPTSHRAAQRQAPPRANRQPAQARPSQVYRNDGTAQPTQSYTIYGNGRMYPQGRPPSNLPRPNGSGQGEKQIFKPEKIEAENTRRGATAELGARSQKIADNFIDLFDTWFGGMG